MQAASLPSVLMQSPVTWAVGSAVTGVLSTRLNRVGADDVLLKANLAAWRRLLHPVQRSLRVSAMGFGGDTTDTAPVQDTLISNMQSMSSRKSNVEGDGAARISEENALGVFTNFIDKQLLQILNNKDVENPVRQTVLMTDGRDTRPYRLLWPSPSLIFDVSPKPAFTAKLTKQNEKGLKLPRSCLLQHVSVDFMQTDWGDDWVDNLVRKGYRGDAPSVWVIEMPETKISEQYLQAILSVASGLVMKGSTVFGVISCPWTGISQLETSALLRRLFMGQGFTLEILSREQLSSNSQSGVPVGSPSDVPLAFIAQQQRLSDAQVEYARMQIDMAEEVEEEGFEDGW